MKLRCKHCNNEDTFYVKVHFHGSGEHYLDNKGQFLMNGSNAHMYDGVLETVSKYIYCYKCHKRVIKRDDEIKDQPFDEWK
ncbi:hypothetical protein [Macrococcus equi]|uniref:hypothetical protein n=1 Tax=Macrococcus equi TaxID=3395462 RepID=UPI0039BE1092